jgi:hypothetical protein
MVNMAHNRNHGGRALSVSGASGVLTEVRYSSSEKPTFFYFIAKFGSHECSRINIQSIIDGPITPSPKRIIDNLLA